MTGIVLAGALVGFGLFLVIREYVPTRPSLDAAVERMSAPVAPSSAPVTWRDRAAHRLAIRISGSALDLRIPRKDLAILDQSVESYLAQKLTLTGVGLVGPLLLSLIAGFPPAGSALFTLLLAIYVFFLPDVVIRSQARTARKEFRIALVAYLELVGLASSAGKGPTEALEAPARIGSGWVFRRLSAVLDPARRGTRDTWSEMEKLAKEIDVQELADIAIISRRSGAQGAKVLESIRAKAASLRADQHASALGSAKSATETMTIPLVLIVIGFMILLGYPAFSQIG